MAKSRIFHLAKEYGLPVKETICALSARGLAVKSPLCAASNVQKAVIAAYVSAKHKIPASERSKNKITGFVKRYKLFMDSSSLLKQRKAFDFFLYVIEALQLTGNKIMIPQIAVREIKNIAHRSNNKNMARRAENILSLLTLLVAADIVEIRHVQRKNREEDALRTLFKKFIKEHNILLITQNSSLAEIATAFPKPKNAAEHNVYARRLSDSGELIDFPPDKQRATSPAAKAVSAKSTKKSAAVKSHTVYCVPFYTEQTLPDQQTRLKRIIVNGNPTNYCVSQTGNIYKVTYESNLNDCAEILREVRHKIKPLNGYRCVAIKLPGNNFIIAIHRLVALAFCRQVDPANKTVDHIDGNKLNNHYTNLEWVTQEENQRRANLAQNGVQSRGQNMDEQ